MLKLPKGLKKKKKGKKSKRKGEDELFTEEQLEKYRREHQKQEDTGECSIKENEEWSKFKDITTGIDSVLKKTQVDLDRIKSNSFFQRVETKVDKTIKTDVQQKNQIVEITEADFPHLASLLVADNEEKREYGFTDEDSEEEEQDDIFDTSFVDAVERGEVKLAYVPDSPEDFQDDSIFDTSHVDAIIRGTDNKSSKGKKGLDIGVAVEVLTGRIDNVTIKTKKKSKRVIPGDLLLENSDKDYQQPLPTSSISQEEKSILDIDADIPSTSSIDLSGSLHKSLIQHSKNSQESTKIVPDSIYNELDEIDEFTLLAAESLENESTVIKLNEKEIKARPIIQEAWSAFEANKNEAVFAECIIEDQIDIVDPYIDQDDPFDTSFADAVVPVNQKAVKAENYNLEEDDDFDPRAEEVKAKLNNRRKSSVRIHLITPYGLRESITSDDVDKEDKQLSNDLLGGSNTDLMTLSDTPLYPVDVHSPDIDPFDTTIVDKIVAPGKIELKLLEKELIGSKNLTQIYRVPSDPDFDPRADEPKKEERRASRPENLIVIKNVGFNIKNTETSGLELKPKSIKPLTPYYTRELSITENTNEEIESSDLVFDTLTRTRSDEDLTPKVNHQKKRRHSEYSNLMTSKVNFNKKNILESGHSDINKVLTPSYKVEFDTESDLDPFDTSFAASIVPSKIELKLLAKEFSCEETHNEIDLAKSPDLLEPTDDIFQIKALTPEPSHVSRIVQEDLDPFDTSFTGDLNPGKTELKLLESEFLN